MKKYIFLLSEDGDPTVDEVMCWLEYEGSYNIMRINDTDRIRFMHLSIEDQQADFEICVNGQVVVRLSQIQAYWYRRGQFRYTPVTMRNRAIAPQLCESINKYYSNEFEHSVNMLHFMLKSFVPNCISSFHDVYTNKLVNLECARQAGLRIPASIVSNNPQAIRLFFQRHTKCIVKPVRAPGGEANEVNMQIYYGQSANLISIEEVNEFLATQPFFQPTHFQEYIEKDFEIRTFVLNDKLFSMAIFSQQNEKTKVDFRNYDKENPNRNVPFRLPSSVEKQIIRCCGLIGINCGSVDMIYRNGGYYFLEINPVGQLQWLSHNCNYRIEKHIAQALTDTYA